MGLLRSKPKSRPEPKTADNESPQATELHNIYSLTMDKFCTISDNPDKLQLLSISGEPTAEQLTECWDALTEEMADIIGGKGRENDRQRLINRIVKLRGIKSRLDAMLWLARQDYQPEIMAILIDSYCEAKGSDKEGFSFDADNYLKVLDKIALGCKWFELELAKNEGKYKELYPQPEGAAEVTATERYSRAFVALMDWRKYYLTMQETTVFHFSELYRSYLQYMEQLEAERERIKQKGDK